VCNAGHNTHAIERLAMTLARIETLLTRWAQPDKNGREA